MTLDILLSSTILSVLIIFFIKEFKKEKLSNIMLMAISTSFLWLIVLSIERILSVKNKYIIKEINSENLVIENILSTVDNTNALISNTITSTSIFLSLIVIIFSISQYIRIKEIDKLKEEMNEKQKSVEESENKLIAFKRIVEIEILKLKFSQEIPFVSLKFDIENINNNVLESEERINHYFMKLNEYPELLKELEEDILFFIYSMKTLILIIKNETSNEIVDFLEKSYYYLGSKKEKAKYYFLKFLYHKLILKEGLSYKNLILSLENDSEIISKKEVLSYSYPVYTLLINELLVKDENQARKYIIEYKEIGGIYSDAVNYERGGIKIELYNEVSINYEGYKEIIMKEYRKIENDLKN